MPSPCSLLLVDDEPEILESLRRALRDDGYELFTTTSPVESIQRVLNGHRVESALGATQALELLRERSFDVLLCDLLMPSMTGMGLHAHLAKVRPELIPRMIFMTGCPFGQGVREFLASVPNERIDKPFEAEELDPLLDRAQAKVHA